MQPIRSLGKLLQHLIHLACSPGYARLLGVAERGKPLFRITVSK